MASSPWAEIAGWLLLPALLWLVASGWALVAERIGRIALPDGLLVPLGFSLTMALALVAHALPGPWALWVAVWLAVPLAALLWVRPSPRRLAAGGAGLSALLVYALYLAPVLLSGRWTWTGYNFLNDTNYQFLLADWIRSDSATPVLGVSNGDNAIAVYLGSDYPLGTHAQLASLTALLRIPVEVGYVPYIAAAAAAGAMAVHQVLRALGMRVPWAVAGAVASLGAALTYQFALQGSIKEVAFAATLLIAAAVAQFVSSGRCRPVAGGAVFGASLAGGIAAYSAAGIPALGVVAVLALAGFALRHGVLRPATWAGVAAALAVVVALSIPSLAAIKGFAQLILGTYAGTDASTATGAGRLGQLQAPLEVWQMFGIWLRGAYILPLDGAAATLTHVGAVLVGVAGAVALVVGLLRRRWGLLALILPGPVALAVLAPRVTPYVDAKLLALAAPAFVAAAAAGLWLVARRLPLLAAPIALVVGVGIVASDALAYHATSLAPSDRMESIVDVGKRYAGRGPLLFNEFEEFAKYFARDARVNVSTDSTAVRFIELRNATEPFVGRSYDLDQQTLDYVESFPYVVLRRHPGASRPPANFTLDYRNADYAVWRRRKAPEVVAHLPLGQVDHLFGAGNVAEGRPACSDVRRLAREAPPGSVLIAARAPEEALLSVPGGLASLPPGWTPDPRYPGELQLSGPGTTSGRVRVRGGVYDVWLRGSFARPLSIAVDGRRVGSVLGINTPAGWLRAGRVRLGRGIARLRIDRGGGDLAPGDGAHTRWGGVALQAPGAGGLVQVPLGGARRLCGRSWDWIEVVRRRG